MSEKPAPSVPKYLVVGGLPFRGYTNTLTYTGLKIVGGANTKKELEKLVKDKFDEHGGLLLSIDTETGKEV